MRRSRRQSAEFIRPAVSIIEKPTRTRLRRSVRLLCPRLIRDERSRDPDILLSIGTILNPADTIGAELKVVFRALGALGEIDGDNSFWLRKCRELMLRPAVEPLLLARWNKLKSFEMTEAEMASFCSLLCGSKQQARTRDSYGLWDGGDVRFEPAEQAASWWTDIRAVANDPQLSSLLPAYAFARTIIAHPFPDGNGRLARALVHASLARIYDLNAPVLPLAPAFYMHGGKVAAALRQLSDSGDWEQFATVFRVVLDEASRLAKRSRGSL